MTYAWVIEHVESQPSAPMYFTGLSAKGHMWSAEHSMACRFARRQDAERVRGYIGTQLHRVAEHGWEK